MLRDGAVDLDIGGLIRRWGGRGGGVDTLPQSILKGVVLVGEQEMGLCLGFNIVVLMTVDTLVVVSDGPGVERGML